MEIVKSDQNRIKPKRLLGLTKYVDRLIVATNDGIKKNILNENDINVLSFEQLLFCLYN